MTASRGQVIRADIGLDEPKLLVVVSNDRRNALLPTVLAVRLTTTPKPRIPSIVEIPDREPVHGRAVCDDIVEVWHEDIRSHVGALSPRTMGEINQGLAAALALPVPD